jgi:hypothetical protein
VSAEARRAAVARGRGGSAANRGWRTAARSNRARGVLVAGATAALLGWPTTAAADTRVQADLVEQNRSGVSGNVTLTALEDGGLEVVIRSRGLVPGQPHAQHIHGSAGGQHFRCPTLAENDRDGDGYLTNEEATGEYGTIFLALTTKGGGTPEDGLDIARMPVADRRGVLNYERTFPARDLPDGLLDHLASLHVVQHGIDANDNDRYDLDGLGVSTFAASLGAEDVPEEATNPASCGVVTGAGAAHPAHKGVETGGLPPARADFPLAAASIPLLLGAAALVLPRHRRRPDPGVVDGGQPPS